MLLLSNATRIQHFFILGFPGLPPRYHGAVSALLLLVYLAITAGNIFILVFVGCDRLLHKPTYLIFCHLALTDLLFGNVTLPKVISKYWFHDSLTPFYACFVQMYFVHFLGASHSFILMVMALDRLLAICAPLRYAGLLTNGRVWALCGASWLLPMWWMVVVVLHALPLPYCASNLIVQCFCDHISITALDCDKVAEVQTVALAGAMFTLLVPLGFIVVSYFVVMVTVMRMSSAEGRVRSLSTCTPQLAVTCLYFLPRCFVYLANNLGFGLGVPLRILVTMLYSHVPAAVNPLIYCFKTKDIKESLKRKFYMRNITSSAAAG